MAIEGYKVTETGDVIDKIFKHRDNFNNKGKYLGWKGLDEFYSMQLGNCTDWTGFPMSGKTQVLMECLLNTSKFYGWKHLVYFPDVGSNVEIVADLIHKLTGKSFNPKERNVIKDREIRNSLDWIFQHFHILTKKDVKAKMTPFQFYDYAVELKQKSQIAEDNELHLHTIIHPKLTEKINGKRSVPSPYDLKGGSEWFNSGKCMITVHREDLNYNQAIINFNKIKPRSAGQIGQLILWFDKEKFLYYEQENPAPNVYNKIYAKEK